MSKMKQIDELTDKLVPQVLHKIYKIVDREMEYSLLISNQMVQSV